jgi:multidrug resistance efflux pump
LGHRRQAAAAQIALCEAHLREAEATRSVIVKSEAVYREVTDNINKAKEAQELARLSHARCDVKALIDGVVARILVREGDFASPLSILISLMLTVASPIMVWRTHPARSNSSGVSKL